MTGVPSITNQRRVLGSGGVSYLIAMSKGHQKTCLWAPEETPINSHVLGTSKNMSLGSGGDAY
jgi:hypothetical protein